MISKTPFAHITQHTSLKKLEEVLPANPFFIPEKQVKKILNEYEIEMEELLIRLIPVAKSFARPPISNYYVGNAALGKSGNIYLGVNLEFPNLPLGASVHGEQFIVAHARNHGETELVVMALSAAPCGHCRQFLNEMEGSEKLLFLIPNSSPKVLSSLLPDAFGPRELGINAHMLAQSYNIPSFSYQPSLVTSALKAAISSYAPYSQSRSGVAIQTVDGKIYSGAYLENAAFNPSLSPLQSALVTLIADLRDYEDIKEVVLVEQRKFLISQEKSTCDLLQQIAPKADLKVDRRDF